MEPTNRDSLDSTLLVSGFVLGLLVGAVVALFKAPRSGNAIRQQITETGDQLRSRIESVVPVDPIAESMAEGKSAARSRRSELGLGRGG